MDLQADFLAERGTPANYRALICLSSFTEAEGANSGWILDLLSLARHSANYRALMCLLSLSFAERRGKFRMDF
jgi:hypothetical protein